MRMEEWGRFLFLEKKTNILAVVDSIDVLSSPQGEHDCFLALRKQSRACELVSLFVTFQMGWLLTSPPMLYFTCKLGFPITQLLHTNTPVILFTHTQYLFSWGHIPAWRFFRQFWTTASFQVEFAPRPNFQMSKYISGQVPFLKISRFF